jgi:hypothetical protein
MGETTRYGQVTLFYDDLTLWHPKKETTFVVRSNDSSLSIQMEQGGDEVKMHLLTLKGSEWKRVGYTNTQVSAVARLDTIDLPRLQIS